MKKFIYSVVALVSFSFASTAQCNEQSTPVTCGGSTTCWSVTIPWTGIQQIDIHNLISSNGTMMRKPNQRELLMIIDAVCL
ncbi:MAG: hypothetical protein ACK4RM_04685 [Flavobacterium sp.]